MTTLRKLDELSSTLGKLDELSYKQLKEELRARELKIVGAKEKIRASLRQDLVDEGEVPETYLFEVEQDIGEVADDSDDRQDGEATFATSCREKLGRLEKEKAASVEKSVDVFVGSTLDAICDSH
ncbi:histone H1B sperm [Biomphalaria pfeifferi]|uniref:Histone H1B sperm n=1 Tax=Biomphalaria pfeifferi TaxID=112525 RepID=A0AAD8B882_BIOPF|nr:histone H1B sperm [Biomphalaria pfeifferi]